MAYSYYYWNVSEATYAALQYARFHLEVDYSYRPWAMEVYSEAVHAGIVFG